MKSEITSNSEPDRRSGQRRKQPDRRDLIRYETKKNPRRRGYGRRLGELKDIWDR